MDPASLTLYTDGLVDAGTRARVEQHITVCSRCRTEVEELFRLATVIADAAAIPARTPERILDARSRVKERVIAIHRPRRSRWDFPASGLPVLGAAVLVLLALAEAVTFGELKEEVVAVALFLGII
jgi:anti-sigma factor RsiW